MRQANIAPAATIPPRHTGPCRDVCNTEQGQTLVEFALSITITLMLIFGLIDFSRAVYTASVVQWAAQEGARAGTVDLNQVTPAVEGRLVGLDLANLTLDEPVVDNASNIITVELSYTFRFITPIIEPFAPRRHPDARRSQYAHPVITGYGDSPVSGSRVNTVKQRPTGHCTTHYRVNLVTIHFVLKRRHTPCCTSTPI